MIGDSFIWPEGLKNDHSSAPRQTTAAADTEATTASDWRLPGSTSIRTCQRVNAIAVRRARNWYPVIWVRVDSPSP